MTTKNAWLEAARAQLKSDNLVEALKKKWGDFDILPIYESAQTKHHTLLKTSMPNKAAGAWLNLPRVAAGGTSANQSALDHLQKGGDGVVFECNDSFELKKSLVGIMPEHCFLGFELPGSALVLAEQLELGLRSNNKVHGALFWTSTPDWLKVARIFKSLPDVRCFGMEVSEQNINNVESTCAEFLRTMDILTDNGFTPAQVLPKFAFTVKSSPNFFLDVAVVRSLKKLFQRVATGYGVDDVPAFVRVCTRASVHAAYEPHGAMIGDSINALAAVAASADAITVTTDSSNSALHQHTARSISVLLKEESKLDKVANPLAGSYFVEALTNEITEGVWTKISRA